MQRNAWVMVVLLGCCSAGLRAQVEPFPPPQVQAAGTNATPGLTGTVSGVVMARDTQRPVRFAQVQLQPVVAISAQRQADLGFLGGGSNVRTDIDGTFIATHVTPGDYYVTATAVGYVAQRTLLQAEASAGTDPAALLARLPQVHVTANATSMVTVTVERGAALAGHVEWEDGSPAAGITVTTNSGMPNAAVNAALRPLLNFGGSSPYASTDDLGNFRMSGLPAGDYIVMATIQPSSQIFGQGRGSQYASPIRIYAPGVFRHSAAKAVTLRAGDERTDVRLVLDLRGMHAVAGTVVSASPGQAIVSGRVTLSDPNDSSMQLQGAVGEQGQFKLPYVPPGTYTLNISGASTVASGGFGRRSGSSAPGVSFQTFSQALVVGDADVSGVTVTLTPVAAP